MLAKLNLMTPMVLAGAVAAVIAAAPTVASDTFAPASVTEKAPPAASTQVVFVDHTWNQGFKNDPGGGGCDVHGNCGSGGQNQGPGGGPGGHGCIPGVGCGSGGQFAGPGGVPGGQGCIPGLGCGSGHA